MMLTTSVGIDIGKTELVVVLLKGEQQQLARFENDAEGISKLGRWLKKHAGQGTAVCLEATGHYGDEVAFYLHEQGYGVSVVNPARIKAYAQSRLSRNKTDALDAALIAEFCRTQQPDLWTPPPPHQRELQALGRHLANLETMRQQERNRLEAAMPSELVQATLHAHLAFLDEQIALILQQIRDHIDRHPDLKQQRDLLDSLPGFGDLSAAKLLAELPDLSRFDSPEQLVAYAGLNPRLHHSGTSVRGRSPLSKLGNPDLRRILYMPALVAKTHSPRLRAFASRLEQRGKPKMVAVGAVMRKLLVLAFAILKSGKPFDPHFLQQTA